MRSIGKKAISEVIATVFLITLSIAAASIIGYFIFPMVNQATNLAPTVSCIELKTSPIITISNACFNEQTREIELTLKRDTKEITINTISFIVRSIDHVKSFKCGLDCSNCNLLNKGTEKKYFFSFPNFKDYVDLTYALDDCEIKTERINRLC